MKIVATGLKCLLCGDIVYSRAKRDFNHCFCGKTGIDGGPHIKGDDFANYMRVRGTKYKQVPVPLGEFRTIAEARVVLFNDWNKNINKLGRISGKQNEDS